MLSHTLPPPPAACLGSQLFARFFGCCSAANRKQTKYSSAFSSSPLLCLLCVLKREKQCLDFNEKKGSVFGYLNIIFKKIQNAKISAH